MVAGAKSLSQKLLRGSRRGGPFEIPLKVPHSYQVLEFLRSFVLASQEIAENRHRVRLRGLRNLRLSLGDMVVFLGCCKTSVLGRMLVKCLTHKKL